MKALHCVQDIQASMCRRAWDIWNCHESVAETFCVLEASIEKTRCDLTSQNEKEKKKKGKKSDSGAVKSIAGYQEKRAFLHLSEDISISGGLTCANRRCFGRLALEFPPSIDANILVTS